MKPNIHLLLLGLLLTTTLTAQNPENNKILRGKVLFQNSNFTPATGVAVAGMIKVEKEENTNKVYSDSRGNYELQFPLARKGHPVSLSIGNTDKTGQELEVVNEKEISLCRIPANASQEFEIIVCPKGARDVAARKYYKILKNSAEKAYEQMQEEFRALTEAQNKDYNSIQQVADDLTKLQEQIYDSIAIYKEAMAIASINKDGVNDRVLNYLKLLDEGKSIQEARKELSISKASNDMEQGIILFRAGVKELEERARASAAVFDYKDAVVCYDTLIGKAEKLNIDQLELSGYYLEAGVNMDLFRSDAIRPDIAYSFNNLAMIYQDLRKLDEALIAQNKAITIYEAVLGVDHHLVASAYNNLATIFKDKGEYEKALDAQQNALHIFEIVFEENHPLIATCYNNLALIYTNLVEYEKALIFQIKSLDTVTKYQNDVEAWNLKGQCHYNLKQYPNTITSYQKAMEIDSTFSSKDYYNNIGLAYARNHQFPEAKAAFEEYQKLYPKEGRPYRNWAMYYALQDQREEALENLEKAIAQGYKDLQWLETDDSMENLRNEPGFKALLE
jgi:tetratricopeptide (TPR) repeat protein